jgi:hypothetical protein
MPPGVEHSLHALAYCDRLFVMIPLMPPGVEHLIPYEHKRGQAACAQGGTAEVSASDCLQVIAYVAYITGC